MLRVVYSHSKSHGHFVANSCLLATATGGSVNFHGANSPTSGNLSHILKLLTDLCTVLGDSSEVSKSTSAARGLLLQWIGHLLETCKPCTPQLSLSEVFQRFLLSVVTFCNLSASSRTQLPLDSVLSALLDLPVITIKVKSSRSFLCWSSNCIV